MPSTCTTPTGMAGSSPSSIDSTGLPSDGTCSTTTSSSPLCGWGLDGIYSDHTDVMMAILAAEYASPGDLDHRRNLR